MSTLSHADLALNWNPAGLVPPELEALDEMLAVDPFADNPGLDERPTLGPPAEPRLPFPDWLEVQAAYFRSLGSELGGWLGARIDRLAAKVRASGARCPAEFEGWARRAIEQTREP